MPWMFLCDLIKSILCKIFDNLKCYIKNEHSFDIIYVNGLDLLYCHANFPGDTISRSPENDASSCYFPDIAELKLSLPQWHMGDRI